MNDRASERSRKAVDEQFKLDDSGSYRGLVGEYDRFVRRFSPPLVDRLLDLARLRPDHAVLDVGAGSGVVALEAGARVGGAGRVIGIDLSHEMVVLAARHAASRDLGDRVAFLRMDAESLWFSDGVFDSVVTLFALLHLPDPAGGLAEMHRVLKPGGRLVVAIGSRGPLLSPSIWPHYLNRVVDRLRVAAGRQLEAPAFLDGLVARYCPEGDDPEETSMASAGLHRSRQLARLVRSAGFVDVSVTYDGHMGVLHSAQEFWDMQRAYSSFARKRLEKGTGADETKREFFRRVEQVRARGGRLTYPYGAVFVSGSKPGVPG